MNEHQHVEWKEAWRDEHMRWICGFANAEGGVLVIGRNDRGQAVGVRDARKLLQDIPNNMPFNFAPTPQTVLPMNTPR